MRGLLILLILFLLAAMFVSRKETPSPVVRSQAVANAGPSAVDKVKKVGGSGQVVLRPTPPPDSWRVHTNVSPITDRRNVYLVVEALTRLHCGLPLPERPRLRVECHENTTRVLVDTNCFWADETGQGRGIFVEYRLDDRKARRAWWQRSNDYSAFGLWYGSQSIPFIRRMLKAGRLTIRATPFHRPTELMVFPVRGLDKHIGQLAKACGWKVKR